MALNFCFLSLSCIRPKNKHFDHLSLSLMHTHTPTVSHSLFAISGEIAQFLGKAITDLQDFQKFYPRVETLSTFLTSTW